MKKFGIACALICLSASSLADGFYVVGDVSQVKWDIDELSTNKTGLSLAGGYTFSLPFQDTMAVEMGYRSLGVHRDKDSAYAYRSEFNTLQFSILASHYFSPKLSAYGRVGIAQLDIDWHASPLGSGQVEDESVTRNRPIFGIGGRYSFNKHLATRLEYTYLKWEDFRFTGLGIGLEYSF
jgi:opacity protein-like surface antigen